MSNINSKFKQEPIIRQTEASIKTTDKQQQSDSLEFNNNQEFVMNLPECSKMMKMILICMIKY